MGRFQIEWGFVVVASALAGFSLSLIWSISPDYLIPQIIFFVVGFIVFLFVSQLNRDTFYNLSIPFYLISILLLLITLLSKEVRGASRWIEVFGFRMQPSEFIKPGIIVSYAYLMSMVQSIHPLKFLRNIALYLLPVVIIFLQPDLGNVIVFLLFCFAMLFANKLDLRIVISIVVLGVIVSPFLWNFMHDYQRQRIISFISPQNDPQGAGYNAIQATIAVGSGKIFGQGLGRGTQSHLRFLPENHTDFIFASLVEELGLFGALLLLSFYSYICLRIIRIAANTQDQFSYLIIVGIFVQILSQVFINISMNIGILPVTGVTLPLISSGGSSLLATFVDLGIIAALRNDRKQSTLVIR